MEDFTKKLAFLDNLKTNDGEMAEQVSEEITKAMGEQKNLENKYGMLVTRRGQLTGLRNKEELKQTKEDLMKVTKQLKNSTKWLCR